MELEAYRLMYELEDRHWWYQGLHQLVFAWIDRLAAERGRLAILDAGCGTGSILSRLRRYGTAFGIDLSRVALTYCRSRGLSALAQASVLSLPFKDEAFDLIVSTDVLYHTGVGSDVRALQEFHRVLRPDGRLLIHVPAHEFLRRTHDRQVHSRHRYARRELESRLLASRFRVVKLSYRHALLLPVMLMVKWLQDGVEASQGGSSDLKPVREPLNALLYGCLRAENAFLSHMNIPFGTSLFCVASKDGRGTLDDGTREPEETQGLPVAAGR